MLLENTFAALFKSSEYFRMVFPHLEEKYFTEVFQRKIFEKIKFYNETYSKQPSISDIKLLIESDTNIPERESEDSYSFLDSLKSIERVSDEQLLIKQTEEWCQQRALENAILESVEVLQNKKEAKGSIEDKIKKALAVEFDIKLGHSYYEDAKTRLDNYYDEDENIAFDIEVLNNAMGGGLKRKSIAVFIAPPKRGKSLWMIHCACSLIRSGRNVLILSCELSERMIAKRVDANMLDIPMNELNSSLDKNKFKSRFKSICNKSYGTLMIKETPNVNSLQVKTLLAELRQKKNFVPDVVVIDYINICSSSTLNVSHVGNSNLYIGKIVMEMRNLAVAENFALLSAVQNNRGGVKKSTDTGMDDIADAFSIAMNVDWGGSIIQNDELREQRKYLLKTILTRWDENSNDICTIGVDYSRMKLLNVDEDQQEVPLHIKDSLKKHQISNEENPVEFDFS